MRQMAIMISVAALASSAMASVPPELGRFEAALRDKMPFRAQVVVATPDGKFLFNGQTATIEIGMPRTLHIQTFTDKKPDRSLLMTADRIYLTDHAKSLSTFYVAPSSPSGVDPDVGRGTLGYWAAVVLLQPAVFNTLDNLTVQHLTANDNQKIVRVSGQVPELNNLSATLTLDLDAETYLPIRFTRKDLGAPISLTFTALDNFTTLPQPGVAVPPGATPSPVEAIPVLKPGDPVPDFKLVSLDGTRSNLGDFLGKPILLTVTSTWCPPCRMSKPTFARLAATYPESLTVIHLNTQDALDNLRKSRDGKPPTPEVFTQDLPGDLAYHALRLDGFPTHFLIDAKGKIVYSSKGYVPGWTEVTLRAALQELIAPKPPSSPR